jgi:hypothetical protein
MASQLEFQDYLGLLEERSGLDEKYSQALAEAERAGQREYSVAVRGQQQLKDSWAELDANLRTELARLQTLEQRSGISAAPGSVPAPVLVRNITEAQSAVSEAGRELDKAAESLAWIQRNQSLQFAAPMAAAPQQPQAMPMPQMPQQPAAAKKRSGCAFTALALGILIVSMPVMILLIWGG